MTGLEITEADMGIKIVSDENIFIVYIKAKTESEADSKYNEILEIPKLKEELEIQRQRKIGHMEESNHLKKTIDGIQKLMDDVNYDPENCYSTCKLIKSILEKSNGK